ncbi:hypothetical protein [Bradyrhizobium erythrophlei]|uniref:Uncharacterized protein n=1 Tax=Bradyrhizobium erythrophlei TaxID=1437360 RepID=A0A1H4Y1I4_9BRAD|nr:hypothetical protein [Bradyrhizobium erythrophlei]SED11816.1 hypothetical protein SAMN05444164_3749 [Bradyrhizobium erythrophlei]
MSQIIFNDRLPCSDHERQIIAIVKTYMERGDMDNARRILSHQTGRALMRRGVVAVLGDPSEL